jgi:hypothetical protein
MSRKWHMHERGEWMTADLPHRASYSHQYEGSGPLTKSNGRRPAGRQVNSGELLADLPWRPVVRVDLVNVIISPFVTV